MKPVIWSVAGNDSGGGAGLGADLRAATAFGVHLCPVVAAVTAQNSHAVMRMDVVAPDLLDAQLAALADDLPPRVIKTGLLGSTGNVAVLAAWVDRLREQAPVALVIDPVLSATSGGNAFADDAVIAAYQTELFPRATLITPNLDEAHRLVPGASPDADAPALVQALQSTGAANVVITGGDETTSDSRWARRSRDWIATGHASGWLALPRVQTFHTHGTGCTFASSAASALALGFGVADALVLAKMATTFALMHSDEAGGGRGPVWSRSGFGSRPELLPTLSWDADAVPAPGGGPARADLPALRGAAGHAGLYAVVDGVARLRQVLDAGARLVQLRIKAPPGADAAWQSSLRQTLAEARGACSQVDATLVVNDHWQLALELAAADARGLALHLGQEDLLALTAAQRRQLHASSVPLGVSSHSLWELARARSLSPWYVACGPVWPTLTKEMPWRPQGLDNLAWWVHMAGAPVVAIGGILDYAQATQAARSGAAAICVVRGLGADPQQTWPQWRAALQAAGGLSPLPVPALPRPTLEPVHER